MATNQEALDLLVRNASLAADLVAMEPHRNEAAKTQAIIQRAVEFLVGNELIEIKDQKDWREWLVMDPPFKDPFGQSPEKKD